MQLNGTELIEIIVTNANPENSAKIANELTKVFIEKVKELYNISNVQIINEAPVPTTPSNINHPKDIAIFVAIGIVISAIYVFIANILDSTIKTAEAVEEQFGVSVLASTPLYGNQNKNNANRSKNRNELIVHTDPKAPISEVFRTLRTNIQFTNRNKTLQSILITSTMPREGKSWVSANLAVTFAQAGKKVILVDADMRKGRQCNIFNIASRPGLSNYLSNVGDEEENLSIEECIQETKVDNLYVISAGSIPPNPSELLVSEEMLNLVEKLKGMCDIVILDGPPTQLVTDAVILARIVDSTVIVAASRETKKEHLRKMIDNIRSVGGKVAGIVVNKLEVSVKQYKETYYYGEEVKK